MKSIKIAHMADLHINTPFAGLDAEKAKIRRHELIEALDRAVETAVDENADIIAIAGDLFDNGDDMRAAEYVMKRLDDCGIPVFIAAGNHDSLDEVYSKLKSYENIHIFGERMERMDFNGVGIYGASFKEKSCPAALLEDIEAGDGINVLIMHGDVGAGAYNPMDKKILSRFDYCALGHIHEYSVSENADGGVYAYSGFCEPRGFDEKGKGGIIIAEVTKGGADVKRHILSKREYIKEEIDISECGDNLDIADKVQEYLQTDNIYYAELYGADGSFAVTPDYIKKCLEIFCFDIDISVKQSRSYDALADGYTLRGRFVSAMLDMASRASEVDRKKYMRALDIGLEAFERAGEKR